MILTPHTILEVAQHRAIGMFTFDLVRYLLGAGVVALAVWGLRRTGWASRKIQKRAATGAVYLDAEYTVVDGPYARGSGLYEQRRSVDCAGKSLGLCTSSESYVQRSSFK